MQYFRIFIPHIWALRPNQNCLVSLVLFPDKVRQRRSRLMVTDNVATKYQWVAQKQSPFFSMIAIHSVTVGMPYSSLAHLFKIAHPFFKNTFKRWAF